MQLDNYSSICNQHHYYSNSIFWGQLNYFLDIIYIPFLVRWSLSGLLLLLFSIYLSLFLFSNYCNFMWFIKLRASANSQVCAGVHGCAHVCAGVHRCVHVCASVHTCTWVWVGVCLCARVCAVCAGVHGWVWKSAEVGECLRVCVLDEFSEYCLCTYP